MRRSLVNLINECDSKMNGYAVLLNYKYMNLCVKAEAASLLNVTVEYGDQFLDVEQVADVAIAPDEYHFQAYPKDPVLLFAIAKAVKKAHPEFGVDVKDIEEGTESDDNADKYLLITMPEVNDDRHDLLVNAVKSLHDECKARIDVSFQSYSTKLATMVAASPGPEADEAKDALQQVNDGYVDMIKGFREQKLQEVEEAYASYMEERNQRERLEKEKAEAHGLDKGRSLNVMEGDGE